MPIVTGTGDSDFSPSWKWADDETLEGTHVEMRKATTEHGETVVWELATEEDGRVSVWINPANLLAKVRRELQNRQRERGSAGIVDVGERVRINPGVKRPSKRNPGQTVWPFPVVWFEHGAPDRSAEELLLADTSTADEENGEDVLDAAAVVTTKADDEKAAGDDIPF